MYDIVWASLGFVLLLTVAVTVGAWQIWRMWSQQLAWQKQSVAMQHQMDIMQGTSKGSNIDYRVLLVCPMYPSAPDIGQLDEMNAVSKILYATGIQYRVMEGIVTMADVDQAITDGKFNVLHFAGHSQQAFLLTSDEKPVPFNTLAESVADRVHLVVLNSCYSQQLASMVGLLGGSTAVGTTVAIVANTAIAFATAYYSILVKQDKDYWDAFAAAARYLRMSFPGEGRDNQYVIIPPSRPKMRIAAS